MTHPVVDNVNKKTAPTEPDALELVHKIMHLVRGAQYAILRNSGHELTHLEGKILGRLAARPGTRLSELVDSFGRDKGQLGRVIKALKTQGLIATRADPEDRRAVCLVLSDEGTAIHATVRRQLQKVKKVALRGFTADQQTELIRLLDRMRGNLEDDPT